MSKIIVASIQDTILHVADYTQPKPPPKSSAVLKAEKKSSLGDKWVGTLDGYKQQSMATPYLLVGNQVGFFSLTPWGERWMLL